MSRKPGPAMASVYLQHWRWLLEQGPSYKLQAASFLADPKLQAASYKPQAASHKLQAPGPRRLDKVSGSSDRGPGLR